MENCFKLNRINISLTNFCNLHCKMCDIATGNIKNEDFTLDDIKKIIKEAKALGTSTIELSGGEPMMRKDIYEIIDYGKSLGLAVFMVTNGTLLNKEKIKNLLDSGLSMVALSLEGPESINDYIRGKGCFEKTIESIEKFQNFRKDYNNLKIIVGITLSNLNYKIIVDFSKSLLEKYEIDTISINPFNENMIAYENLKSVIKEFYIKKEFIPDLTVEIDKLIELSKKSPGKSPPINYLKNFSDYFMHKKILPKNGCNIPSYFCGISAQGDVHSCWQMTPIGNIKGNSLKKLLNSKLHLDKIRLAKESKCNGCLSSCYCEEFLNTK